LRTSLSTAAGRAPQQPTVVLLTREKLRNGNVSDVRESQNCRELAEPTVGTINNDRAFALIVMNETLCFVFLLLSNDEGLTVS